MYKKDTDYLHKMCKLQQRKSYSMINKLLSKNERAKMSKSYKVNAFQTLFNYIYNAISQKLFKRIISRTCMLCRHITERKYAFYRHFIREC